MFGVVVVVYIGYLETQVWYCSNKQLFGLAAGDHCNIGVDWT